MVKENVIEKIRNLLNVEGRSEEEAAQFLNKAKQLMDKYDIEMFELEDREKEFGEKALDARGRYEQWMMSLFTTVCYHFYCRPIIVNGYKNKVIMAVGYKKDIEVVKYAYDFLFNSIDNLRIEAANKEKKVWKILGKHWSRKQGFYFKRSFNFGAIQRIASMLRSMRKKDEENVTGLYALVVSKKQEVNHYVDTTYDLKKGDRPKDQSISRDYYNRGYKQAGNIQLNTAIGS
jgi:hypothetical protein